MTTALSSEKQAILALLQKQAGAMDVSALLAALGASVSRRSLQRWLAELVAAGLLEREGQARATRYRLNKAGVSEVADFQVNETLADEANYESYIPLSPESREIMAYVRKPLQARNAMNYERDFLGAYIPGRTWYLDEATRGHLLRVGDTGEREQPIGTYGRAILDRLLIDLSWSSSKLEGNTYTRLDTEQLIQHGQEAEGKGAQDAQMILNHKRAIELIVDDVEGVGFNRFTFLNLHGLLSENLLVDSSASGRLRMREVNITGSMYKPSDIPQLIEDSFHFILNKAAEIRDPFEQAFFILVHIPYLQPFEDVNKRVSRIGANISFMKHNLCPLTFLDVPEQAYVEGLLGVYEMNRIELLRDLFIWAYERSAQKYIQVKNALEEPEEIRLQYRNQLHEVVAHVVRETVYPYEEYVREFAKSHIANQVDREPFVVMALDDIKRLHEGVLVRYRLKLSDFQAWMFYIQQH